MSTSVSNFGEKLRTLAEQARTLSDEVAIYPEMVGDININQMVKDEFAAIAANLEVAAEALSSGLGPDKEPISAEEVGEGLLQMCAVTLESNKWTVPVMMPLRGSGQRDLADNMMGLLRQVREIGKGLKGQE
jgi:hypothetical protein